jgi:hypothetical protein
VSSLGESIQKFREKLQSLGKKGGSAGGESAGAAGGKFDAKIALAWVKANPVIVASLAVMLVVPGVAWWFASDIHAEADKAAEARAKEMDALEKLEKTPVEIALPGRAPEQQTGVVTTKMVSAYEEMAGKLRADSLQVQKAAVEHNRAGRTQLLAPVVVTDKNANLIADEVFDAIEAHEKAMLAELRVGGPVPDASLAEQLQRRQDQFIAGEKKTDRKSLNEEQVGRLREALREKRLQIYADRASNVSFFGDIGALGLPASSAEAGPATAPNFSARLFLWQWRTWIVDDILRALAAANKPYRSVMDAPVKRLVSINVAEEALPAPAAPAAGGGEAPAADAAPAPAAAIPAIDPKSAVPYDFRRSFTGLASNSLYDVRRATVNLVVATTMLPDVLDAIARQNFMTVVSVTVRPADAFAAIDDGFVYGAAPVSDVRLVIESIWLREWTGKLMPPELQAIKGTNGRTTEDPPADVPAVPDAAPST